MVRRLSFLFVLAVFSLSGCKAQESIDDALADISTFHGDLDAGDYGRIWKETAPVFREATSKDKFEGLLKAIHTKLGNVTKSEQVGWRVNATTDGTYVVVQMATEFAEGTGQEVFTYLRNDNRLSLAGYNIQSNDMMVK
ncbi:DUF4019 domain-containing protein [Altericroceibacterium spongiae]|uniref:DUF4019 domain-containing protein n=1 Tax=Altericroceibacterium spongiae TaxID=2320269 RepID=A0A420EEV7_9SPHN|nr:DUF4019 domain-containing protein [Altericroceibacterium spongiae]RKF19235.1 DUF4019 domain-containing protein [Altericroceibacterium spongiae]